MLVPTTPTNDDTVLEADDTVAPSQESEASISVEMNQLSEEDWRTTQKIFGEVRRSDMNEILAAWATFREDGERFSQALGINQADIPLLIDFLILNHAHVSLKALAEKATQQASRARSGQMRERTQAKAKVSQAAFDENTRLLQSAKFNPVRHHEGRSVNLVTTDQAVIDRTTILITFMSTYHITTWQSLCNVLTRIRLVRRL